jgi:hypothetical protein
MFGRQMAVDLGTANTVVYVRGQGITLDEPSVVAINATTYLACGCRESRQTSSRHQPVLVDEASEEVRPSQLRRIGMLD